MFLPLFCPTFLMDAMSVCREFIVLLVRTVHVMLINAMAWNPRPVAVPRSFHSLLNPLPNGNYKTFQRSADQQLEPWASLCLRHSLFHLFFQMHFFRFPLSISRHAIASTSIHEYHHHHGKTCYSERDENMSLRLSWEFIFQREIRSMRRGRGATGSGKWESSPGKLGRELRTLEIHAFVRLW